MSRVQVNNVTVRGNPHGRALLFAHGFGCSQDMWRAVAPHFEHDYKVVLFDHVGAGDSDSAAYDPQRHATLDGYAADVVDIIDALGLDDVVIVGHSVSAMIAVLAQVSVPDRISGLVLVSPSPRYLVDDDYPGVFARPDMEELLQLLDRNYLAWSAAVAPMIMGNPDRPELAAELEASFCRTDPDLAKRFARVTFLSDNRGDLGRVTAPTLVLQCARDAIAPVSVGQYVHGSIPSSDLVVLDVDGHCPNLSAPDDTAAAIRRFLEPDDIQAPRHHTVTSA